MHMGRGLRVEVKRQLFAVGQSFFPAYAGPRVGTQEVRFV